MIRRKSTIDHAQRQKHTKNVQIFSILDLCLQLPSDDRILIRNQIKNGDQQVMQRIYQCKRDKNYHALQIYLRKYVQKIKQNTGYGLEMSKNNNRGKTPITIKSTKNPTQSSYHNSLQNSLQSSPSAKKPVKLSMTRKQIEKHIENQIDKQIYKQISKQECQIQCKDITPRQIRVQIKPIIPLISNSKKNMQHIMISQPVLSMKDILKAKLSQKANNSYQIQAQISKQAYHHNELQNRYRNSFKKQNIQQKTNNNYNYSNRIKTSLTLLNNTQLKINKYKDKNQEVKYGEFYKRIKQVIQQAR